ncbi:SDR family NAD(P)-dependent oxidoreductase [Streptomyces sp. NPDC014889]|uniref:SDR family NAD(P)-dependent oxidoreductase n=1 Tax=Streptomyces sp. NPDC014889 TaxID=3364928 RepID=UPI0036FCF1EB
MVRRENRPVAPPRRADVGQFPRHPRAVLPSRAGVGPGPPRQARERRVERSACAANGGVVTRWILCNNAGVNGGGPIDETPLQVWRWVFSVNIEGQFTGVSTFLPRFKQRGRRAHIVNTASMAGIVPVIHVGAYASSKFASVGFSMVLRDELRGTGVGVSLLVPGTMATRINATAAKAEARLLGQDVKSGVVAANNAVLAQGADPDRVGAQVLEAMRERQFLIVTHRDFEPLVSRVHAEIERAFREFDGRHGPDAAARMLLEGRNPVSS